MTDLGSEHLLLNDCGEELLVAECVSDERSSHLLSRIARLLQVTDVDLQRRLLATRDRLLHDRRQSRG